MKTLSFMTLFVMATTTTEAMAENAIHCGEGRAEGAGSSEISLVHEELESKFYLRGRPLPVDDYEVASAEGKWIVTVFGQPGQKDRKFEFLLNRRKVQEFLLEEASDKAVGRSKNCLVRED